jgi:rRNA-processing protein FCF1
MKLQKVYLDTSVINFLYADDAPDFKKVTEEFFYSFVRERKYDIYISNVVIEEINETQNDEKRKMLLQVVKEYELNVVILNEEANRLANVYVTEKIIPERKIEDARHIAITTVNNIDILLSWNFKHLANVNKKIQIKLVNEKEGYFYPIDLLTPIQLIYENE